MSNNPNFNNKGGRPIYNYEYEEDDVLCYADEKAQALLGYFATSSCVESIKHINMAVVILY